MQFTAKMLGALAHFAKHRNKTEAYHSAYNTTDMLDSTVRSEAWKVFEHPLMKQAVAQMNAVAAAQIEIDARWVMERLARIADFNIRKFVVVQENGKAVYDFREATDDDWYCIGEYSTKMLTKADGEVYPVEDIKIKTESKMQALKLCGSLTNVGAFVDKLEVTGAIGVAQLTTDEYKQARKDMMSDDEC